MQHNCSAAALSEVIHRVPISFHLVPITAWWAEVVWIQNLPKAFTHHQCCGNRTPDPLIWVQRLKHSATHSTPVACLILYQLMSSQGDETRED